MKFNIGDKLHISGDITVTGAYKCGDGIYSYNTDVGAFHEPALDKLVCAAAASAKPQDKPAEPANKYDAMSDDDLVCAVCDMGFCSAEISDIRHADCPFKN